MPDQPSPEQKPKKKNWFLRHKIITGVLAIIVFIIVIASLGSKNGTNTNTANTATTQNQNINTTKTITIPSLVEYDDDITSDDKVQDIKKEDVAVPQNYTVISAGNTNVTNPVGSEAIVSSVVDGDTVKLSDGNKVRILGIDTPETVDPRKAVQCFGKEASAKMKELVNGKKVVLLVDVSQGDKDKYGRLLRYIYIGNTDIGAEMIKEGYAFAYTQYPVSKMEVYKALEKEARDNKRGLWAENTCNGSTAFPTQTTTQTNTNSIMITNTNTAKNTNTTTNTNTAVNTNKATNTNAALNTNTATNNNTALNVNTNQNTNTSINTNQNTNTALNTNTATNTNTTANTNTSKYTCDCKKTCTQITTCEEAYFQLNDCGCAQRDGDKDGVPCEDICPGG